MKKIAVLGSTNGTDFPAVFNAVQNTNAKISIVISNKSDSGILQKAREKSIETLFLNPKDFNSKEDFDKKLLAELQKRQIDLIVLIGYMKWITKPLLDAFKNKIINVHPSLLPLFPGIDLNVHKDVLDAHKKTSGATVFFVDEGEDSGPIILQKSVEVIEGETIQSLKEKVQLIEQEILPKAIQLFCEDKLKVKGKKVLILE